MKQNVLAGIACVAAVASIAIAGGACATAKNANEAAHESATVQVLSATDDMSTAETAALDYTDGNVAVTLDDGEFVASAGTYILGANGAAREFVAVEVEDSVNDIVYNESKGYLTYSSDVADYRITNVSELDAPYDTVIKMNDADGNAIIVGQKKVTESTAVFVVASNFDSENILDVKTEVNRICNAATRSNGVMNLSVLGQDVNAESATSIALSNEILSFGETETAIYAAPYNSTLKGAGFDDEVSINDEMTVKAGSYQDANSGLMPFIYNDENGTVKFVAAGEDVLKAAFAQTEPVIKA